MTPIVNEIEIQKLTAFQVAKERYNNHNNIMAQHVRGLPQEEKQNYDDTVAKLRAILKDSGDEAQLAIQMMSNELCIVGVEQAIQIQQLKLSVPLGSNH